MLQRLLGLFDDRLDEGVDQHHVRSAVDPYSGAAIADLADMAGGAVETHHLVAGGHRGSCGETDRQAVRVFRALIVGDEAESLDVLEERTADCAPVGRGGLDFEREQPVDRIELASFGQVIVPLPFRRRRPLVSSDKRVGATADTFSAAGGGGGVCRHAAPARIARATVEPKIALRLCIVDTLR